MDDRVSSFESITWVEPSAEKLVVVAEVLSASPAPPKSPAKSPIAIFEPNFATTFPLRPILPSLSTTNPFTFWSMTDWPFFERQERLVRRRCALSSARLP